jgi:TPR repeat protein
LKEAAMQARLWEKQERRAAEKRAFENDPKNIDRARQFKLRQKYELSYFIEKADFPKLMDILRRVDNGVRLSEDEVVWLTTGDNDYFTVELRVCYHKIEADYYAGEFKKNKDLWTAVNASSHYRKCREPGIAESILNTIDVSGLKNRKLKSAICTTHGGVKRDLAKWDEALCFGEQAHLLTPQDFRPCTLLGAVNIEIGHYNLGKSWYEKAVKRGYSEKSVDDDLRTIFMRAEKTKKRFCGNIFSKQVSIVTAGQKKSPLKNDITITGSRSIHHRCFKNCLINFLM